MFSGTPVNFEPPLLIMTLPLQKLLWLVYLTQENVAMNPFLFGGQCSDKDYLSQQHDLFCGWHTLSSLISNKFTAVFN